MSECKFKAADGECLRERAFPYKEYCVDGPCTHYTSITNADRIRAMTDEDLAEYICIKAPEACPSGICTGEDFCYKCWLDWLKQEADDD